MMCKSPDIARRAAVLISFVVRVISGNLE